MQENLLQGGKWSRRIFAMPVLGWKKLRHKNSVFSKN
jgi:hypothetical protein